MTYNEYYTFIIPFGKYRNRYLSSLKTDPELEYLFELHKKGELTEYIEFHARVVKQKKNNDPFEKYTNEKLEKKFNKEKRIYKKTNNDLITEQVKLF